MGEDPYAELTSSRVTATSANNVKLGQVQNVKCSLGSLSAELRSKQLRVRYLEVGGSQLETIVAVGGLIM